MSDPLPELKSVEQFLFEVPPYALYALPDDLTVVMKALYARAKGIFRIDGHCPFCRRPSTFTVHGASTPLGTDLTDLRERVAFDSLSISCVRNDGHLIRYYFRISKMTVEKVGQYPSLATISNDEVSPYRQGMNRIDSSEFHKAIGLAAHGVGVGSFVYLRRVFERLIYGRFEEFKITEGWTDDQFYPVRMEEKVALLKDHLPEFLVQNRKIYSILSIGIHELSEDACLSYFEVMKQSIFVILEDDKKKKEELDRRAIFSGAIAKFDPKGSDGQQRVTAKSQDEVES
jgi:hypothetical protein